MYCTAHLLPFVPPNTSPFVSVALIEAFTHHPRQALFLPEASDYIASSGPETVSLVKPVDKSEFVLGLREEARREKLPIHVGVHEPGLNAAKVKNTLLWINEQGEIAQRYQKIHLFDVDIKDGPVLKESK